MSNTRTPEEIAAMITEDIGNNNGLIEGAYDRSRDAPVFAASGDTKRRKLKITWSLEAAQDLKSVHNIDIRTAAVANIENYGLRLPYDPRPYDPRLYDRTENIGRYSVSSRIARAPAIVKENTEPKPRKEPAKTQPTARSVDTLGRRKLDI